MRAVPSHPMGHFPWDSHSHGQDCKFVVLLADTCDDYG